MSPEINTKLLYVVLLALLLAVGILVLLVSASMLVGSASSAQPPPGVRPPVDLTQQANPDPATVGQPLTFTIEQTNIQPYEVSGVHVWDYLPEGVNFVSATPSQGSCALTSRVNFNGNPYVVECDVGTLPSGVTATIDVVVIPTLAGTIANLVADPDAQQGVWANITVNEAQSSPLSSAPLSIAKSANPNLATSGQPLTYTITETNNQASTFPEVAVRDLLPDDVTFVSATPSQGECDYAPSVNNVFCELGDIPSGGTATVDIVVTPARTGTITNTAYDILNNRAGVSVSVPSRSGS